jgi:glycosyltransferase involved in cell wall biosynthesis
MEKKATGILHIDTGREWRGGQQQAAYLLEGLVKEDYNTALVCQPQSALERYVKRKNLPCISLKMRGEWDFLAGRQIAGICRVHNFHILHLHTAHALSIGFWIKVFFPTLKLIGVRRVDFHIQKNWLSQKKYKNRYLDKIVCISEGIKKVLISDGIPEKKLVTIHSGVDIDKFCDTVPPGDFRKRLGIPDDHILIGTVASLAGHKDYPNLLRAARRVIDAREDVSFCAVGDGPKEEEIQTLAGQLELRNHFVFAGFREDIGNFLKSFDIFVLASKLEGLGTSILDAHAVGLPVVASDTGGIGEVVLHNQNGLLVPPQDEKALSEALLYLIENTFLREKMGREARETVKRFDIKMSIRKNMELYSCLMDRQNDGEYPS